jgi:2-polyprenyl-3-methyl-5-hydroxy-6-metoxy-1,4-benzoquinol methylase
VGYDIAKSGNLKWEEDNNNFLTTNFQKVVQNGTYDAIMLWDVLDHAKDPNSILRQIRQLCTKNTEIFVKCHPWCGVHGGHAYTKLNKAYAHLIFTDEELKLLGIDPVYTNKVISPMSTYRKYFKDNKFEVKSEYVERTSVDTIFKHNPLLKKRIMSIWKRDLNQEFPEFQMEQEFINYDIRLME